MGNPLRLLLVAPLCALVLLLAPAASNAATAPFTKKVAVTGTKGFHGTYTIQRFVHHDGKLYSVGTLRGTLNGKSVRRSGVRMPARLANAAKSSQITPTPGSCQILNLKLGPIDLNLLGLRVRTNEIDLRIEAIPGGGLLGDLLCSITNLLNPSANTPLAQVTRLLNALLALVQTGPATAARTF